MKRDMSLIQAVLEHVERYGGGVSAGGSSLSDIATAIALDAGECSRSQVRYHAWLCVDAGFVDRHVNLDLGLDAQGPLRWDPPDHPKSCLRVLTWKGHDALEELRRDPPFLANRD